MLIGAFVALALLLASIGVYALFASMAVAREWELGLRLALGSSPKARGDSPLGMRTFGARAGTHGPSSSGNLFRRPAIPPP